MRKMLVISDTHHNFDLMGTVFAKEHDIDSIIHLGDEHDDLDFFPEFTSNKTIYSVPGLYHKDYYCIHKKCIHVKIENWEMILAHSPHDLQYQSQENLIYIHGHTHKATIRIEKGSCVINPGHLKALKDRGEAASYMIFEIDNGSVKFILKNIQGELLSEKIISKNIK